jgi:putative heme-binding domain-containing protein
MHRLLIGSLAVICAAAQGATPQWLDERFELPPGFHIYRVAGPDLSGGSYALTFDAEGRLLVGDGNAVRRLSDRDGDGLFDHFEVIATGLGPRGPQGLLVYGDRLYAVGGDGIQLFENYSSGGPLTHQGRLGNKLSTGGDHDAHTIFRGHDGWLYFMAGNGSGLADRRHITEESSPAMFEREASVFRISPDGQRWECLASGGRNPPSLGMNFLGELFSFDSDMEWHVALPWYRPVRLNHWALGGDQGWQEVGAYPSYYIDNLSGIIEAGRGSPNWGVFYEHTQLPGKYRDAFLVCDYRWKRESNDQYATAGRLVAFFLTRNGGGWKASMETLVRPRPGARDTDGKLINFALVDVAVAPDGSLFASDHNQGIWRIVHDSTAGRLSTPPAIVPSWPALPNQPAELLEQLLTLPQPGAERTRLQEAAIRNQLGPDTERTLQRATLEPNRPLDRRLRALRLLAPDYARLSPGFVESLAKDSNAELRGQAAWLLGLRGGEEGVKALLRLLRDKDPFVRRRAAESFNRVSSAAAVPALIDRLGDEDRLVRHVAMTALAHRPSAEWFPRAASKSNPQIPLRALAAATLRKESPPDKHVRALVDSLLSKAGDSRENQLDLLRLLALYRKTLEGDPATQNRIAGYLRKKFPDKDRDVRWEQVRLLGEYRVAGGFAPLLRELEAERDPVAQFHIAQALSAIRDGWTSEQETRAINWFLGTQRGWFSEFDGKGVQFPEFWSTVLTEFAAGHREAMLRESSRIEMTSLLGSVTINLLAQSPASIPGLLSLYRTNQNHEVRLRVLTALKQAPNAQVERFLQEEYNRLDWNSPGDTVLGGAILQAWAAHPDRTTLPYLLYEGLFHDNAQVVRASATALVTVPTELRSLLTAEAGPVRKKNRGNPDEAQAELAADLISRMMERPEILSPLERVLVTWSGRQRSDYKPEANLARRSDEPARAKVIAFWQQWFGERFRKEFQSTAEAANPAKTDAELQRLLLSNEVQGGNVRRGGQVYETLQCQTCHGGGVTPGREGRFFGPDLAGVTRRLSRTELADALVYPSKQVADRFKAVEVALKDSTMLTGFLTEQTAESVTLADREQVHRLSRTKVHSIAPLATSLMPDNLLNRLSADEIRDLLAFLDEIGGGVKAGTGGK